MMARWTDERICDALASIQYRLGSRQRCASSSKQRFPRIRAENSRSCHPTTPRGAQTAYLFDVSRSVHSLQFGDRGVPPLKPRQVLGQRTTHEHGAHITHAHRVLWMSFRNLQPIAVWSFKEPLPCVMSQHVFMPEDCEPGIAHSGVGVIEYVKNAGSSPTFSNSYVHPGGR